MLNENQTFSRPNQDVLSWMSFIMGWVNSEFRCCRGIESRDELGLIERNDTDVAQWTLVSYNYHLLMSQEEEEEEIVAELTTENVKNWGYNVVKDYFSNYIRWNMFVVALLNSPRGFFFVQFPVYCWLEWSCHKLWAVLVLSLMMRGYSD